MKVTYFKDQKEGALDVLNLIHNERKINEK